jgi:hypothetical protein
MVQCLSEEPFTSSSSHLSIKLQVNVRALMSIYLLQTMGDL